MAVRIDTDHLCVQLDRALQQASVSPVGSLDSVDTAILPTISDTSTVIATGGIGRTRFATCAPEGYSRIERSQSVVAVVLTRTSAVPSTAATMYIYIPSSAPAILSATPGAVKQLKQLIFNSLTETLGQFLRRFCARVD